MVSAEQLEQNVKHSFERARQDMIMLAQQVETLKLEILALKAKKTTKVRTIVKRAKTKFVASKAGKKVHAVSCAFAKNIKPKMKKVFASKNTAFNQGYKPCRCV
jgi:hypothetical protein